MKRAGVISYDMLLNDMQDLKTHVLMYDELWVPGIDKYVKSGVKDKDYEEIAASIEWLFDKKIITLPAVSLNPKEYKKDKITSELLKLHDDSLKRLEKAYPTAERAAREAGAALFNIDIALSRLVIYLMWRDHDQPAYPVFFPFDNEDEEDCKQQSVLSVLVKNLPVPSPEIPFEDLVAFKQDRSTQYKYKRLWDWVRNIAKEGKSRIEIQEEIDSLMTDYKHHLGTFTKKTKLQNLRTLITIVPQAIEDIIHLKFGKAAKAIFDIAAENISVHEAELEIQGKELAYIVEANEVLSGKNRRR